LVSSKINITFVETLKHTPMLFPTLNPFSTIKEACERTGVSYLGGINISSKLMKNQKISGHYTYIVYLAPASTSGFNVCSHSSPECRAGCLATSGRALLELRGGISRIQQSRIRKTIALNTNPSFYLGWLFAEISAAKAKAERDDFHFSVRLNGTSDIDYAKLYLNGKNVFETFPDVEFYDYTKDYSRFDNLPTNYNLTFSYSGWNWDNCVKVLARGYNVATVFNFHKNQPLPTHYKGYTVINGDITDLRIKEGNGIIVGLYWKKIANKTLNEAVRFSTFAIQEHDQSINQ
jgi:hypothetical protein